MVPARAPSTAQAQAGPALSLAVHYSVLGISGDAIWAAFTNRSRSQSPKSVNAAMITNMQMKTKNTAP
jgi:hypothetical protein